MTGDDQVACTTLAGEAVVVDRRALGRRGRAAVGDPVRPARPARRRSRCTPSRARELLIVREVHLVARGDLRGDTRRGSRSSTRPSVPSRSGPSRSSTSSRRPCSRCAKRPGRSCSFRSVRAFTKNHSLSRLIGPPSEPLKSHCLIRPGLRDAVASQRSSRLVACDHEPDVLKNPLALELVAAGFRHEVHHGAADSGFAQAAGDGHLHFFGRRRIGREADPAAVVAAADAETVDVDAAFVRAAAVTVEEPAHPDRSRHLRVEVPACNRAERHSAAG